MTELVEGGWTRFSREEIDAAVGKLREAIEASGLSRPSLRDLVSRVLSEEEKAQLRVAFTLVDRYRDACRDGDPRAELILHAASVLYRAKGRYGFELGIERAKE